MRFRRILITASTQHGSIAKNTFRLAALIVGSGLIFLAMTLLPDSRAQNATADTQPVPIITCDDFDSWTEAYEFFIDLDPTSTPSHHLDSNANGIPCEGIKPRDQPTHEIFDVNCNDFHHREEAEHFTNAHDTDAKNLYGLDGDLDHKPCEALPPSDNTLRVLNRMNRIWQQDATFGGDANCSDFETWSEANAFFIQAGGPSSDPHRLDGNSNGIPCESLPGAPG